MKIIHTADLHLIEEGDRRWQALIEIALVARSESAQLLVVSGDLFESVTDAEALRPALREVFEGRAFETLIIPGNHDAEAFAAGLYFGEGARTLSDRDWSKNVVDREGVRFIGMPFEDIKADEFFRRLRSLNELVDPERTNVLMYHGELLDASFDRDAFGSEIGRYMPSRLAYFSELGVDYVLAGHFHSNFDVRKLEEGGFFVYPGSPVSITRREVGPRHAALIDVGKEPRPVPLETHHYTRVDIVLDAFSKEDPLKMIKARLHGLNPLAKVLLSVGGAIRGSEEELAKAIRQATRNLNVEHHSLTFRDLSRVMEHPVFALFDAHLEALQDDMDDPLSKEDAESLRQILIRAMTEAGA